MFSEMFVWRQVSNLLGMQLKQNYTSFHKKQTLFITVETGLLMKQLVDYTQNKPNVAYLYAILGNFTLAIAQTFFKRLTSYLHPFQAIFLRSFCIGILNIYLMRKENKQPYVKSRQNFLKLAIRIIVNTISSMFVLYCLGYLPVSTVITLYNMGPIFIYFIEFYHYKHKINLPSLSLTLLSFAGVVLLIQPQFLFGVSKVQKIQDYSFYMLLMFVSAFTYALNLHFVHGLSKVVDPMVNMYYSHLGNLIAGGIVCNFSPKIIDSSKLNMTFILLIICMSVFGIVAQNLVYLANSLKKPSVMMPFGYVGVVTGFLIDLYFFDTQFTMVTVLGIFLTSGGLLSGFMLQFDKNLPPQSKQQRKKQQMAQQNGDILLFLTQYDQNSPKK